MRTEDDPTLPAASRPDAPTKLAMGAAAELLVASRIALLGYQVYRPLADDRGVDLLVDVGSGRHVAVQVKAVQYPSGDYAFMRKSTFPLSPWTLLCLAVYGESLENPPQVFYIPATEWQTPRPPFASYDYPTGKSVPEFGLSLRKGWMQELAPWKDSSSHLRELLLQAHSDAAAASRSGS